MASFVDRCLLQLRQPAAVANLLKGSGAAPYPQLERLISSVFRLDDTSIHSVVDVLVSAIEPMVMYAPGARVAGSLTQTQPGFALTDVRVDVTGLNPPQWAHLLVRADFHVVAAVDAGGVESAVVRAIENIQSLADFRSRFRYLDLDAFLAAHRIATVEQLRAAADYLLTEIRLAAPAPFDPQDPANAYDVSLDVALVIAEEFDLAGGLQNAQLLRAAARQAPPAATSALLGTAVSPLAVAVVLPASGLGPGGPAADDVDGLYVLSSVLPLFASPP